MSLPRELLAYLGPLVDLIADRVAERLAQPTSTASEWLAIKDTPLEPKTIKAAMKAGHVRSARVGRRLLVNRMDVEKYIASRVVERRGDDDELDRALRLAKGRAA
jgi:hypothetical protein